MRVETPLGLLILIGLAVVIVGLIVAAVVTGRREKERLETNLGGELAIITENIRMTAWGLLCVIMLIVMIVGSLVAYAHATTVFQQIEAGVSLIAGVLLFGLGVALGRRRSYTIYRSQQREPY